ncbi:MAG: ribonuclease HIII [Aquificae bacterium]|nr:ribonuclease HIII [Aquificota bacterium]
MVRRNYSIRIPEEQIEKVYSFLSKQGLREREVEHSLWSFEGEEVYLTMYPSGILLIQGREGEKWSEEVLGILETPQEPVAGCDEAGKGDIFGPLVICCAVIPPENFLEVLKVAPKDSKKLKKDLERKAEALRKLVKVRCITLMPERFNELYKRYKNINRLMDDAYKRIVERVREEFAPSKIVIDRYSGRDPFQRFKEVEFVEKGERDVAVSVASIIAKDKFLRRIRELEETFGIKIPLSGSLEAKELARRLKREDPELARKLLKEPFTLS